jgi:penicillin-insensitive murein endopeptidase
MTTLWLTALLAGGCLPWAGLMPYVTGSINRPFFGFLSQADALPAQSDSFRFYNKGDRPYGAPALIGLVRNAARKVSREFEGSVLLVGDLSASSGGKISHHSSHRTGLDVDFAFFVTDAAGRPEPGAPLTRFDMFGAGSRAGSALVFDRERNWSLIEALLTDEAARVQWIFVSNGLKALLLEWALTHGRDLDLINRAASVLHQPGSSLPHDDHFHVRIYCPNDPSGAYCVDEAPIWPWIQPAKPADSGYTDQELTNLAI